MALRIGIDVGGTHTDAVILDGENRLVAAVKTPTTPDVTTGIAKSVKDVIAAGKIDPSGIEAAMLGTTHCTNAIVERRRLSRIGLLRIGKPATTAIKPYRAFPEDLKKALGDIWFIVGGGHEYDGREITPLDEDEVRRAGEEMKRLHVEAVAVCSVFSPVCPDHEVRAAEILRETLDPDTPITLSHEIGSIGLLERENASALNAALIRVAETAVKAFREAMRDAGVEEAELYLTQNDGTLMNVEYALKYPIRTVASGPTNSIRGAAYLTGTRNGIVVDIGGTTTLVGALTDGFPRESAVAVEIGGVRTNFRMPDLIAISCGGGTIVKEGEGGVELGPESLGYRLVEEGMAWGGKTLTTTDVALAAGYAEINDPRCNPERLRGLDPKLIQKAVEKIVSTVEEAIDRMKTSPEPVPVVLVGGGGIIIPKSQYDKIKGVSQVIRPEHFQYANAIGAAIAEVSGEIDRIFSLEHETRTKALEDAKEMARREAVKAGAREETVKIVHVEEIPLAYLPGNAVRIRVKASGELAL
ncbi:MAG: hydantoinase/oxoprolinase family protein [Candidatus Bathyarchaeia archaeon]